MKKIYFCCLLLIASTCLFAEDSLQVNLDEVLIDKSSKSVFGSEISYTNEDISRMSVSSVNDMLEWLPSVDIRTRGPVGVQADMSIRGGTFDQSLILLNGVNFTDPRTGHASMDLPLSLGAVDKVNVYKNVPISTLGTSSFSGAVDLTSCAKKESEIQVGLGAGMFGYVNPTITAQYHKGRWNLLAAGEYNRSSGYVKNTDYELGNVFLHMVCDDPTTGKWGVQLGGQMKWFGSNSFYSLKYPDQYEHTKTALASLTWDKNIDKFSLSASVYGRAHFDRFELFREGVAEFPSWYTGHNYHSTTLLGGTVRGRYNYNIGHTDAGIEVRNEHILSNVLGDALENPVKIFFADGDKYFTYGKNRLNVNYFLEQSFLVKDFGVVLGAAGNYNTMFKNNFSFSAEFMYRFATTGKVYANVNRALRMPTFTDLYYKSATQIANPDLKPEKSITADLGACYSWKGLYASVDGYYRYGTDIIDWVKAPEEEKWRSVNHTRVDAWGAEVLVSYSRGYWLKKAEVSYSYCGMNKSAGDLMSKYALDYLKHKVSLTIEHGIYKGFGASWSFQYRDRNGSYTDKEGNVCAYQPVFMLDGKVYWQGKMVMIYAEATNMLNQHYYDYGGVEQPGAWFKGGITVTLK